MIFIYLFNFLISLNMNVFLSSLQEITMLEEENEELKHRIEVLEGEMRTVEEELVNSVEDCKAYQKVRERIGVYEVK